MPRITLILLALLLGACAVQPSTNRYQQQASATPASLGAVERLQQDAITALDDAAHQRAIDLLQRAIRIEPRNAKSWQLLAAAWQEAGDPGRCVEMAERAASYGHGDAVFERENSRLLASCQGN